eukprot:tig00000405_g474.t1
MRPRTRIARSRDELEPEAEKPPLLGAHSSLPLAIGVHAQCPPALSNARLAPRPASAAPAVAVAAPPRFRAVQISLLRRSRTRRGEWERATPVVAMGPPGASSAFFFDVSPNEELRLRLHDPVGAGAAADAPWAGARVAVAIAPLVAGVRQAMSAELVMLIGRKGDSVDSFVFGAPPNAQAEMVSSWLEPAYGPIGRDRIVLRFSGAPLDPPAGPPAPRKRPTPEEAPAPPDRRRELEGKRAPQPPISVPPFQPARDPLPPAPSLPRPLAAPRLSSAVPPAPLRPVHEPPNGQPLELPRPRAGLFTSECPYPDPVPPASPSPAASPPWALEDLSLDISTPLAALLEQLDEGDADGDAAGLPAPPAPAPVHPDGQGQAPAADADRDGARGAALTPQRVHSYFGETLAQTFSDLRISPPPEEESEQIVHRILLWDTPAEGPYASLNLMTPPYLTNADLSSSAVDGSPPLSDAKLTAAPPPDEASAWDPAGPPPFLLSSDAERHGFTQRIMNAHDLVRTTWHAEDGAVLAKMLSDARVLDTPLVSTHAGRLTFQACLHAVRGAAMAEGPVDAVVAALLAPLAHAPEFFRSPHEAAVASAACRNLAAALGCEAVQHADYMLFAPPEAFHMLSAKALDTARAWGDPTAVAEALFLAACLCFMEYRPNDCSDTLFEAWSVLLKAGLSPSRAEARIVRFLGLVHVFTGRAEMADHFLSRMYWYTEGDEDASLALDALAAEFVREGQKGDFGRQVGLAERAIELCQRLAEPPKPRIYRFMISKFFAMSRARRFIASYRAFRAAVEYAKENDLLGYSDFDVIGYTRTWWWMGGQFSMDTTLRLIKTLTIVFRLVDSGNETPLQAHLLWAYGDSLWRAGRHAEAAAVLEQSLQLYGKFPRLFPPDARRVRRVREALARAQSGLLP